MPKLKGRDSITKKCNSSPTTVTISTSPSKAGLKIESSTGDNIRCTPQFKTTNRFGIAKFKITCRECDSDDAVTFAPEAGSGYDSHIMDVTCKAATNNQVAALIHPKVSRVLGKMGQRLSFVQGQIDTLQTLEDIPLALNQESELEEEFLEDLEEEIEEDAQGEAEA